MRYRLRLFLSFSAILLAVLLVMVTVQLATSQREQQQRTSGVVRDFAILRGALEDGLVDESVYLAWYKRVFAPDDVIVWIVDANGIVKPADSAAGQAASLSDLAVTGLNRPFGKEDLETYLAEAFAGDSHVVIGDLGGRLGELSVTVAEPVVRQSGEVTSVLCVSRKMNKSEQEGFSGPFAQLWLLLAAGCALLLGVVLIAWQSTVMARPIEGLAKMQPGDKGDDVAKLSREIAQKEEQIAELEDLRKGFVSNVSHELRSPLTNIIGYLQGVVDGAVAPQDRERYTGIALEEARRMSALIGDLLNLSRIESGRFPLSMEKFDICEMLRRVLVADAGVIEGKAIRVHVDFKAESLKVEADPQWIRLAVDNILGNAVKFVEEGGNIMLRVQPTRGRAYVTIADDGPGIAKEDIEHVFEWFYKADKAHSTSGTGLGLAIARSILDRHGQAVRISSQDGKGTVVTFTLALAEGMAEGPEGEDI